MGGRLCGGARDAPSSLEMIAAAAGVHAALSAEKAAKAITDKINASATRSAAREQPPPAAAPAAPSSMPAPSAMPAAPSPAAPAGAASGRSFAAYNSRDMEGGDYQRHRGVSLDQCEDYCKRDGRCQAFSYDIWNRFCLLKSSINALRLEPRSVTRVPSGVTVTNDDREPVIQRRAQKAFPTFASQCAKSYDDCAQRREGQALRGVLLSGSRGARRLWSRQVLIRAAQGSG
jgi:hypothetical protein